MNHAVWPPSPIQVYGWVLVLLTLWVLLVQAAYGPFWRLLGPAPDTTTSEWRFGRCLKGLHPRTGEFIGQPVDLWASPEVFHLCFDDLDPSTFRDIA